MNLFSIESDRARRQPASAFLLEIIGALQFITVSMLAILLSAAFHVQLGPVGTVLGMIGGIGMGLTASVTTFALARIVSDLSAVRWNSEGYAVQDSDELVRAIDRLNANMERLAGAPAPDAEDPAPDAELDPEPIPEPIPDPEPEGFQISGAMRKLLYALAALLAVSVILMAAAVISKL